MSGYRVDNVPLLIRPFYIFVAWVLGLGMYLLFLLWHKTCTIKHVGLENINPDKNYIYCFWHYNLPPYYCVFIKYAHPYVWMNHPAWFMKPIHVLLKLIGTEKIVLGSSGHSGKKALGKVVSYLKQGYSTVITPDGPAGPPLVMKPGVIRMSEASGIPIVALDFKLSRYWQLKTWDKKRLPLPFSTITINYRMPVTGRAFEL